MLSENILKSVFQIFEVQNSDHDTWLRKDTLFEHRFFDRKTFNKGLRTLDRAHMIITNGDRIRLTEQGWNESKRIVRLHRLWELYLYEKMNLAADHIHPNAETMEHVITPDLEKLLIKELDYPQTDPHESKIPD